MSEERDMKFSLTVSPGLEETAHQEFCEKWKLILNSDVPEAEIKKGKIFLEAKVSNICPLIPYLKIPSNAYLIIAEFKAKDRPKLFNKISKIEWHKFLRGDFPLIKVSTKKSKLIHTRGIEESATSAIEEAFKKHPLKSAPKNKTLRNKIHIDIYDDQVRIELSLTGDRMDKRGYKLNTDLAPLRESLAAALIYRLSKYSSKGETLLDPMSGTGTFSLEALNFYSYNDSRDFDYQYAPYFIKLPLMKRVKIGSELFSRVECYDLSPKAIAAIRDNLKNIGDKALIEQCDYFNIQSAKSKVAIINPPYGKRIKLKHELDEFVQQIITHAKESIDLDFVGLIFPSWAFHKLKDVKVMEKTFLSNGGIEVVFTILDLR
ncbi:putative methylase [Halobacteriovorax marinus SJ]|uniref:Methylase n=1 Tax=Halobacteriovorax marinus (strain ATCC BAA-682 / DSM 15412 / SJ) TaxID=862908 RepID=E1X0A3_HALMS|nr:RNA methyltransferase [Halobacteriovorax marinus]CBW26331.1 putative methylase [Halobacteriovorax marinus SJ]